MGGGDHLSAGLVPRCHGDVVISLVRLSGRVWAELVAPLACMVEMRGGEMVRESAGLSARRAQIRELIAEAVVSEICATRAEFP